jgi:hypothetical protein
VGITGGKLAIGLGFILAGAAAFVPVKMTLAKFDPTFKL